VPTKSSSHQHLTHTERRSAVFRLPLFLVVLSLAAVPFRETVLASNPTVWTLVWSDEFSAPNGSRSIPPSGPLI
jgi:hypothetical protein